MGTLKKSICLSTALLFFFVFSAPVPSGAITLAEEEELSREFLKVVYKQFDLIKDPYIVDYVNSVGGKILQNLPPQPFAYEFHVINSDVYNAFATPAGHIFIYRGLIEAMESEDELAGILGHEIAHVQCRHISDKIDRSAKMNIASLAALAAGVFLGVAGAGQAAHAVTVGSMAATQSLALAYSREDEIQADKIGLDNLDKAGYDASALMTTLEKIRSKRWFDNIPTYLTTHPAAEDRIAYIDAWVQTRKNIPSKGATEGFVKAHTKLLALYGDEKKALDHFGKMAENFPENPMARYGYGLILARSGFRGEAVEQLKAALEKNPLDSSILGELGRIYFLNGRLDDSISTLEGARGLSGNDPEVQFHLARAYLAKGKFDDAAKNFEELIENRSDYDQAYYFLGDSYGKLGNMAEAHYNLGLFYMKRFDPENSVFHLQKALAVATDPIRKEKIEKMLENAREDYVELRKSQQAQRRNTR